MPAKKLILFDIDGTILLTHPTVVNMWKNIVEDSVAVEFSVRKTEIPLNKMDGLLDHRILEKAAEVAGVSSDMYHVKRIKVFNRYKQAFEKILEKEGHQLHPIPGAVLFLDILTAPEYASTTCLGIVTGNNSRNGWKKLEVSGLKKYFSFGAFSDNADDRPALVQYAKDAAASHFLYDFHESDVIVIGDTRHDIDSAKKNGYKAIAVASGFTHSLQDLINADADLAVSSLDDPRVLEFVMK